MTPPTQDRHAPSRQRFFGKYRGIVMNNLDPQQIGRVQVQVPAVLGATTAAWALPCVPVAGPQMGLFVLPPVGADVWVEFEGGDPDAPIWVGGFWTSPGDLPPLAQALSASGSRFVIETSAQNGLAISDQPGPTGGIVLKSSNGATLIINESGIHLQNGQGASIDLVGPEVSVNSGALAVI